MIKKLLWFIPIIFGLLFVIQETNAAVTFNAPGASSVLNGSTAIAVRATVSDFANASNATLFYRNGSTEAWISVSINTTANVQQNSSAFVLTPTDYQDTTTSFLNITFINSSNTVDSGTLQLSTDNNPPNVTSYISSKKNAERGSTITFTCSGSDTVDTSVTYTQALIRPRGAANISRAGSIVAYRGGGDLPFVDFSNGYTSYCYVTDDAGNNRTATISFNVLNPSDDEIEVIVAQEKKQLQEFQRKNKSFIPLILGVVGGLVILGGLAWLVISTSKSNKKRRR